MPQVSDVFGPIYQQVTLDGSGNGTVTFQAVGANVRLSNIFFKVATSTNQAVCTIYKGTIADGNVILLSNSGSTGGNAKGNVDLFDGERVFVRWTGGDAGAVATATFTGGKIPFSDRVGTSNLTFDDPVAAGDGSLIYPAIKSPNYVAGTSGWSINRTGTAEFNNITVRGELDAVSPSGSYVRIFADANQAEALFQPPNVTGHNFGPGSIGTSSGATGSALVVAGPSEGAPTPGSSGSITLRYNNTGPVSYAEITADVITLTGLVEYSPYAIDAGKGFVISGGTNVSSGAIGATETLVCSVTAFQYRANRAYRVEVSGLANVTSPPRRPSFRVRKDNGSSPPSGTQLVIGASTYGTTENHSIYCTGVFTVGGADVTTGLIFTALGSLGFNVTTLGTPAVVVNIYDIGAAADHALDPVLT